MAVLKRLRGAAGWLEHIVGEVLGARTNLPGAPARPLRLTDGASITGPGGGEWRIHATCDPGRNRFEHLEITDATGAEKLSRGSVRAGEIRIADRNYSRLSDMRRLVEGGADCILRVGWRKVTLRERDGGAFDLFAALDRVVEGRPADVSLLVADHQNGRDLPVRLVVLRKPDDAAEREHRRVRRRASKSGKKLSPKTLTAANYMMLLTSLPAKGYDATRIASLYRLRWQIEIAFKRMKSLGRLDRLPAKVPRLARSWIAAHLVAALLTEDLSQDLLDSFPSASG